MTKEQLKENYYKLIVKHWNRKDTIPSGFPERFAEFEKQSENFLKDVKELVNVYLSDNRKK